MATRPNYRQDILDNPVQRAERTHLLQGGISRFWYAIYLITIFTIAVPILTGFTVHFFRTFHDATVVWILLNVVCIFVVEMRIMSHAAESIRREFQGKTWDLLILTGVNTWRLILGKWLGAIRGNQREILFLYFLRVVTFFWGMVLSNLRLDGFGWYYSRSNYPTAYIWDIRFDVDALMMGAIIMAVFLALEIMLVASLPLVFSLFKRTRNSATWIALGLRIGLPLAFGFLIMWSSDCLSLYWVQSNKHIVGQIQYE